MLGVKAAKEKGEKERESSGEKKMANCGGAGEGYCFIPVAAMEVGVAGSRHHAILMQEVCALFRKDVHPVPDICATVLSKELSSKRYS